ncbi:MAG: radical SAM protein [Nitrospirae bacterium]|nr:radical SAM protein [Nitrospirota bacterium]
MKVVLTFPPSWIPSQPYLSIPSLTAYLRRAGIDVIQRDLNIETLEVLLDHEKMSPLYKNMAAELKSGVNDERGRRMKSAVYALPGLANKLPLAKVNLRTGMFYDMDCYLESLKVIDNWMESILAAYHPSSVTLVDNQMRYSVYSSADILAAVADEKENPFFWLFKEHIVPSIVKESPGLVGISITATSQMIPGLTLAYLIKKMAPEIHITVGGSIFTKFMDIIPKVAERLFTLVDSFILFEGEHPLLRLIEELEGKMDFKSVPNLVYRKDGHTYINESFHIEDPKDLPTPDYDGFPLRLYLAPKLVLPLQTSRGCYWRRCAFCNLHLDHLTYRPRPTDKVMEDLATLRKKYDTNFFFFSDECVPIPTLRKISEKVIEEGIDIRWTCGVRFEKELTKELLENMSKAGCLKLVFGLESFSQRVLDMMGKGTSTGEIRRIVNDCLDTGIALHLYIIVGFPSETEEEAKETFLFVMENERLLDSKGFSCLPCLFDLQKGTPIMESPIKYGIKEIKAPAIHDMTLGYFYETEKGMSPEQADRIYSFIHQKINERVSPFPYNYSMSDGLLYIAASRDFPAIFKP